MLPQSRLKRMEDALSELARLVARQRELGDDFDFERLIDGYLETRGTLAREFRELSVTVLVDQADLDQLQGVREAVGSEMRALFAGIVPNEYLVVRGYGAVHKLLYSYLLKHVGNPVPAAKLRVLTGDQTHTERRVRDLRGLGLAIDARTVADENAYVLESEHPDRVKAARFLVERNVRNDRRLSAPERVTLLSRLDAGPAGR